jgi:hypothetical protein
MKEASPATCWDEDTEGQNEWSPPSLLKKTCSQCQLKNKNLKKDSDSVSHLWNLLDSSSLLPSQTQATLPLSVGGEIVLYDILLTLIKYDFFLIVTAPAASRGLVWLVYIRDKGSRKSSCFVPPARVRHLSRLVIHISPNYRTSAWRGH